MIRIGIVGIGFMGMIHLPRRAEAHGRAGRGGVQPRSRRSSPATGAPSAATSARPATGGPQRRQEVRPARGDARRPRHRPHRRLQPDHLHPEYGHRGAQGRQARPGREGHRPEPRGRRRHARGGQSSGQAADGRARAAVLPRVRLRGRGHARAAVRQAARRRTSSASSRGRTGRPTSATPPRPAARPSICTSTTRTSSAWSRACRSRSSPPASSRTAARSAT